jgi:glycosyltransferase involved in cell wall biosynthesis
MVQARVPAAILAAERDHGRRASLIFFSCIFEEHASEILGITKLLNRAYSGLYLHPRQFHPSAARAPEEVKPLYKLLMHSRFQALATMNEDVGDKISEQLEKPVIVFPEITDEEHRPDHPLKHRLRKFAGSNPLVVLAGYMGRWKGAPLLARVSLMPDAADLCFAFVGILPMGAFSADNKKILEQCMNHSPNSLFHLGRVPDGECYNALVDAANVLFCAFEDFQFSSNTQTKAAIFERPVIVSEGHLMAERVRDYRLGEIIPQSDPIAALAAIRRITNDYSRWLRENQPRWTEYREAHSYQALKIAFKKLFVSTNVFPTSHLSTSASGSWPRAIRTFTKLIKRDQFTD